MTSTRLLLVILLAACRHSRSPEIELGDQLTRITDALPTDSAVLATLARTHPCEPGLPPARPDADSLPPSVRCTLVATALAAIRAHRGAPEVLAGLPPFTVAAVRCFIVHAEAYRNTRTGGIETPRWTVEVLSDRQPALAVDISRLTGDAQTFRVLQEFGFTAAEICAHAT